jgi:taurine dioxygenase
LASVRTEDSPPANTGQLRALAARRVRLAPYDVEVGPLGQLADERNRLRALRWRTFDVAQLGATIGAELRGVDLNEFDDEVVAELSRALLDYKVLFFRDQDLTPAAHVALARRFGDLEIHPFISANPEHPELVRFEKGIEVGGYENGWHSDVSWRERPSMGTILRAVQVPPTGGDTLFADMYAAYDGLDAQTRAQIADLRAVHDYTRAFGASLEPDQQEAMRRKFPPVEHPVVRRHPDTGRPLLYVNRFFVDHVVGLEPEDSRQLVERLSRQAEQVEYQCRFHWRDGSVAFWDNRAVQHYAASDYWPDARVMERASIVGDRPR